ncbi:MauE/DoxX family redox-associated membrane protein [Flavobacterium sp.]|uniref:MauE/DoxX family redox-associated membrane protein n=1 Tax=Flavobacterium sp. TaxID=239 RepID=UPI003750E385
MKAKPSFKKYFIEITTYLYILLFTYAAVSKVLDFQVFQIQLRQSPLLSSFADWVSWSVPMIEIGIAVLLFFPKTKYVALHGAFVLMIMFCAYIYIIINYSAFIPCSCGGILEKMNWEQHLIFNVFFVLIAAIAIVFYTKTTTKTLIIVVSSAATAIGVMTLLFVVSENKLHYNNNFTRRFQQHPIKQVADIDLEVNSYYFAGTDKDKIYLGNTTTPSLMTVIDTALKVKKKYVIQLDNSKQPFRSIQIRVKPPYFFVLDGTVPCIYRGNINDWKANLIFKGKAYFDLPIIIDITHIAFRTINPKTKINILGSLALENPKTTKYNAKLLQKQIDGIFDTDGTLSYSEELHKIVYTYYYRNQFIVADKNLKLDYRGKTIDTTQRANIKVATLRKQQETKLETPASIVNKNSAICKNLLFINSDVPGRHESQAMWKQATVVDVYNISDKAYLFSTYVYNVDRKKMKSFAVTNNHLFALIGNHLVAYRLMPAVKKEFQSK